MTEKPQVTITTSEGTADMDSPEAKKLMEGVVRRTVEAHQQKQVTDFQKVQDDIDLREVERLKVRYPTVTLNKDGDVWRAYSNKTDDATACAFANRPAEAVRAYLNDHEPELLNSPTVILRTDYLKAAAMAAGTDDTRAYLTGVFVEVSNEEGVRYTATDGHHLVTILDDERVGYNPDPLEYPDFAPFTFLIPGVVVKELDKLVLKPKKGEDESLFGNSVKAQRVKNDLVFTSLAGGDETKLTRIECRELEGQYPDYRRVIPSFSRLTMGTPAQLVSFNWALCYDIQRAWALYRYGKPTQLASCPMNFGGEMEPALFTRNEHRFVGVVMPLRCSEDGRAVTDKPVVGADPFAPPPPPADEPDEDEDEGEDEGFLGEEKADE